MLTDRQTADYLTKTHRCPTCQFRSQLIAAWHGATGQYNVRCGVCGQSDDFEPIPSLTQMWRNNPDSVPITIANRLAKRHGRDIEAVAEGLPPELAAGVREKYFGPQPEEPKEKRS